MLERSITPGFRRKRERAVQEHNGFRLFGGELLFGGIVDVSTCAQQLDRETCEVQWWRFAGNRRSPSILTRDRTRPPYVPLVHRRKGGVEPVTSESRFRKLSEVAFLITEDSREEARRILEQAGWRRLQPT